MVEQAMVLVVDDEPAVRGLASRILTRRGFTVLQAEDGAAALEAVEGKELALLLTDVVLPGMKGDELARTLEARHPDLSVIFMSGFGEEDLVSMGVARVGASYIRKPFTAEVLTLMVDGAMNG